MPPTGPGPLNTGLNTGLNSGIPGAFQPKVSMPLTMGLNSVIPGAFQPKVSSLPSQSGAQQGHWSQKYMQVYQPMEQCPGLVWLRTRGVRGYLPLLTSGQGSKDTVALVIKYGRITTWHCVLTEKKVILCVYQHNRCIFVNINTPPNQSAQGGDIDDGKIWTGRSVFYNQ